MARKRTKKKRKIKGKSIIILMLIIVLIGFIISYMYNLKISVITVKGNTLYSEWEIIKKAGLSNYPSSLDNLSSEIEKKLEKDPYIKEAHVHKSFLTDVSIEIKENLPLFYYVPIRKTVLADKTEVSADFPVPTVINYIPDKSYNKFLKSFQNMDYDIVKRISEIKYDPNDVDTERFLLTMNDGNYVYLTLRTFDKINNYLDIVKEFNNKKGILYLDSGEYFKILE